MNELAERRKRLFSGAKFSSALFFNGDPTRGSSALFRYFSGCNVDGCYLVLKRKSGVLLTYEMNYSAAKAASSYPVKLLGKEPGNALKAACGRGKVGFCAYEMPVARHDALKKKAALRLVDASEKMEWARGRKSARDVAAIAASAKITRRILDGIDPWECRTEAELATKLKIAALEAGGEVAYEPIVAAGKNSRHPHHDPGSSKLGDFVLVDFGVKYDGYCSDFTRCYFRKKGTREEGEYEKCKAIFKEIVQKLPECERGRDVAALSEKLLRKHGLPKLIHSIGHGIGLEVHEYPHLGKKSSDSLEGAVLAIEPAAYNKSYGVRFEDTVANTKKGWQLL